MFNYIKINNKRDINYVPLQRTYKTHVLDLINFALSAESKQWVKAKFSHKN